MKENILIKAIILLCKILLIVLGLTILLLTVYEFILGFTKKEEKNHDWVKENNLINQMMSDKLSNKNWTSLSPIWKYEHEGDLPPKGDKKRILVVGDSFVWGDGYTNPNMLWWQQLRNKLALNGYNEVEIVALGLCGYSTQVQFEQLSRDEIRSEIDPDFIIFGYVDNDPELRDENENQIQPRSNNDIIDKNKFLGKALNKLWPNVYNKLNEIIIEKYKNDEKFKKKYGYDYEEYIQALLTDPWDKLYEERALLPLIKLLNEKYRGIEYLFVPLVNLPSETEYDNFESIINIFDRNDINYYYFLSDFIDKYPDFTWDNLSEWYINPANMHPSYKATSFYAEAIYNKLIRSYGHIIGPKSKDVDLPLEINDTTPYMLNAKLTYKNTYEFTYPKKGTENAFLTLPIKKPYVKLNLKYPKKITRIEITGENIESIHLFTNQIHKELGYDDDKPKDLGEKKDIYVWEIEGEEITSINISANIRNGNSSKLTIRLEYN